MTAESGTAETEHSYRSSGSILRQAREEAGLTQEEVVAETRMTLYNLRALENDDFKRLPSDTFTRGYLRIYAKLLKLDVDSLVEAYEQTRRDAGLEPELIDPVLLNRRGSSPGRPLWYFIGLILAVLVLLWILSVWFLGNDSDPPVSGAIQSVPAAEVAAAKATPGPVSAPAAVVEPAAAQDSDADEVSIEQVAFEQEADEVAAVELPSNETVQSAPLDRLDLTFSDECWLVVTDAQGDVLVTDLVQPGRELNLQGQAPFEVRMGNAHAVQLSLNGAAFDLDIPAATRLMTVSVGG